MLNPSVEPTSRRESAQARRDSEGKARRDSARAKSQGNIQLSSAGGGEKRGSAAGSSVLLAQGGDSTTSAAALEARNQRRSIGLKVCMTGHHNVVRGVVWPFWRGCLVCRGNRLSHASRGTGFPMIFDLTHGMIEFSKHGLRFAARYPSLAKLREKNAGHVSFPPQVCSNPASLYGGPRETLHMFYSVPTRLTLNNSIAWTRARRVRVLIEPKTTLLGTAPCANQEQPIDSHNITTRTPHVDRARTLPHPQKSVTARNSSATKLVLPPQKNKNDHQRLSVNDHMKETLIQSLEDVARDVVKDGPETNGIDKLQTIMTQAKEKVYMCAIIAVRHESFTHASSPGGPSTAATCWHQGEFYPRTCFARSKTGVKSAVGRRAHGATFSICWSSHST